MKKIYVCCPGNTVTGGPELLHQLVAALRSLGHDAAVSYFPFDQTFETPVPYQRYGAPQALPQNTADSLIVLPEVAVGYVRRFRKAQFAIWWLSIDNFYFARTDWPWRFKRVAMMLYLKRYRHFAQSQYAQKFLSRFGIRSALLTDYLSNEHLKEKQSGGERRNLVLFNPKKGKEVIDRLRTLNPDIEFRPLQNMTNTEVAELLSQAKVYVDFGNHPGKDRFPREAAMAGAVVITGRRGAAAFFGDVPIDNKYKIDESKPGFETSFRTLIGDVFENFDLHARNFEQYRTMIRQEPDVFLRQVHANFGQPTRAAALVREA
jgi:hypothetical protein